MAQTKAQPARNSLRGSIKVLQRPIHTRSCEANLVKMAATFTVTLVCSVTVFLVSQAAMAGVSRVPAAYSDRDGRRAFSVS